MRLDVISRVARKELTLFFASPIGYLFLAGFLAVTLFVFFWVEKWFARNIADVRPMFEWLPILLIFLSAALTMRMWSEERRSGTLEFVATVPASTWEFVLGKFIGCCTLLAIALLLTLPLPVTVAMIADLDWGPVLAGYLAALLLGGAYISIGLFVSAKTDSQIVSLMLASLLAGLFYMFGSATITELFGSEIRSVLLGMGSGARFESITRGVLDFRDLYFYASIAIAFLALNVYALERERWAAPGDAQRHKYWRFGTALLVVNLLLANVWLAGVTFLRWDMTEGKVYSISTATKGYLQQLREPLLIRGYFSKKTHPDLAPLVPRLQDLLLEYQVAGGKQVKVEIVDPAEDPELENEANTKYGIRAVPFQVADRHQASLVNSYFDVLIQYGDEYEVLGFRDLIEVKVSGESEFEVRLANPEFDITRSIKKVLYGFQGGASVFDNISTPVEFVGYISADGALPAPLIGFKTTLTEVLDELTADSSGMFSARLVDPEAGDGQVALDIAEQYGFQPMAASLFDDTRFYFYLTLKNQETIVQLPLPEGLSADALKRSLEEGLKRFAQGLLKTVVLTAPEPVPPYMQQQGMPPTNEFMQLQDFLTQDFDVQTNALTDGQVPASADMLIVVDPNSFTTEQVFAIDQFLMKGGTVVVSSGAFAAQPSAGGLTASPRDSGLQDWLAHHGVSIDESLVMDPQNAAFPVPVTRQAGGFSFQDLVMLDYPYFVDVRGPGLKQDTPITTGIPQITVSWASPITVNAAEGVAVTSLLQSSEQSWLSTDTNVMPRFDEQGMSTFAPTGEQSAHMLGVALQGRFESFFAGQSSPLLNQKDEASALAEADTADAETAEDKLGVIASVIEKSPESARLLVFSSNDFLADQTIRMVGSADGTLYGNSLQMIVNTVDWALEDESLIGIRARGNFNRTLPGMSITTQQSIEYLNYGFALLGVLLVWIMYRRQRIRRAQRQQHWLGTELGGGA